MLQKILLSILILLFLGDVCEAQQVRKITTSWTSDGAGAASATITFAGRILRVVTNPGAAAPTDNYDVTFIDADGLDLFMAKGVDRDTINSEHFCPGMVMTDAAVNTVAPITYIGSATLTIAAAGAAKNGAVVIYYAVSDF